MAALANPGAYAALAWSVSYGTLALGWASAAPGFRSASTTGCFAVGASVAFAIAGRPDTVADGGLSFVRLVIIGAMGLAPRAGEPPTLTGWATWAPGWLWPFWGITLGIATIAYDHRRRDRAGASPR